jgi:hypothetical protein
MMTRYPTVSSAPRGADLTTLTAGAIVTHQRPDWDAIVSTYLAWCLHDVEAIVLVPAGTPAHVMPHAVAICDVGGVYDPGAMCLDHHQNPHNQTSAAALAWACYGGYRSPTLERWVATVTAADLGQSHDGAADSRQCGLHAVLSAWTHDRIPDTDLIHRGFTILEQLHNDVSIPEVLEAYHAEIATQQARLLAAEADYARCLVYQSADGRIVALDGASALASQVAYDQGAWLVLFHNADTQATGISRKGELTSPHVGELVDRLTGPAGRETADWWRHPAGFFAGLSPKAGTCRPMGMPLGDLAAALDAAWRRA